MALELDTLKANDDENVILNNTTGVIIGGFYDLKTFKECLFDTWKISDNNLKDYFKFDELEDFFIDRDIEYNEDELKALFRED